VVIDDVGLLPISADAAEALFRVVDAAYEKRSRLSRKSPAASRICHKLSMPLGRPVGPLR
jgi:hypothetical protein